MSWRIGNEQVTGPVKRAGLPQLDESKITLLKDFEWWDGPLTGVIEYEGRRYWFDYIGNCARCDGELSCDCDDSGRHYFYAAIPLTDEQLVEIEKHFNDGRNSYMGPDLRNVTPVGWFTDGCNQNFYGIVVHKKGCDGRENCDCIITKK